MNFDQAKLSRRKFLRDTAASAAVLAAAQAAHAAPKSTTKKKPNILWIMSDEHNYAITGAYGNKLVQTPHIDSLAAKGITFDTHYCNSPLCVPSRASLTAGKYASRVDAWGLTSELPDANMATLPRVLNAAGYKSYLCGKQHYDYTRRYGFIEWGGNFNNNYKTGEGHRDAPTHLTQSSLSDRFESFHPGDHSSIMNHDQKVTAGTLDFFAQHKDADEPWFLFVGYLAPHFPLTVPQQYFDRYKDKVPMPEIPEGYLDSLPLNYKVQRAGFQEIGVPDAVVKQGRECYYGLTNWVDDEIGKVLAALEAHPHIAENTIIVYSSDHGENMGEHGMWWKNNMFETAARVPLIVSYPKRWKGGQRRKGASSHLDLVQTLIEVGGGTAPKDWNGISMLAWMDNSTHKWKDTAVSEYWAQFTSSGYAMVRQGDWKYVYHCVIDAQHPDEHELYFLPDDPKELHNLASLPEHKQRIVNMHKVLVAELGQDPNLIEQRSRKQLAEGYHRTDPKPNPKAGEAG
ncbi:sulfatase-like hydrolase/transferase [Terriglobus roseus]|uniref:Choline-sulfatase n=1 Tax=Terriglobus roseus TaxID=392734 RepID=A0A1G7FHN7_9BACT|nr:sulfatase-like hydrolase/transferase [Terriglobus roseus]SDE75434.1 choline-sulfatase [Terriglobus roseus]